MSDMPARTLGEADRPQKPHLRHSPTSNTWSSYPASASASASATTSAVQEAKRMAITGTASPKSPHKRPWDSSTERSVVAAGHDSAEEDELSDETSPTTQSRIGPGRYSRTAAPKRKDAKPGSDAPSTKRSKRGGTDSPSTVHPSAKSHSRTPSPRSHIATVSVDGVEPSGTSQTSEASLSVDEIDTFLDLIYKHHPEPMTAENMRKSCDNLYHDWEQFCARRQVPVRLAKKPLMDEYGRIFKGVYGPEFQAKAKSIAHELSQRSANAGRDTAADKEAQGRDGSRRSFTRSTTDEDSDDEEADDAADTTGGDNEGLAASLSGPNKKAEVGEEANESGSSKKSNIAQVGRNGLAVLPPGLFDILRNHLRDDILSSIMPSMRNDLTEQTRELFLQNQDLFGRIKEMEDRIRNQDLWIRHLLSRDPAELTTPPVGLHMTGSGMAGGEPGSAHSSAVKSYPPAPREPSSSGRHPRHGPSSEGEMQLGAPSGDYFANAAPMSPRQAPRNEPRHFPQQGMAGPHPWDGRLPAAAGPSMGPGPSPATSFGSGRWEAEAPPTGAYRDRPPPERRPSHTNESFQRPGSWQGEPHAGRGFRPQNLPGERSDMPEGRYEPQTGPPSGEPRLSFGERRRLSAFGSGAGAQRGAAPAPGTGPPMGGMHDEFRRPGPPMHAREPLMSPMSPAYDTRRPHLGLPVSHSEPYFGSSDSIKAPLPPRAAMGGSPEQMQKNKRGRPSKAEMANSRVDSGPAGHNSFSGTSHPSSQPRPYLS